MPSTNFTLAQDKALLASILALPTARVAGAILFLMIRNLKDRAALVAYVAQL